MIKAIRGMKDILPPETGRWQWVEGVAREVFHLYGYRELRLPLLEKTELFARSIGQDTDIVAKEMYSFADRHGEFLTLRPEATAQVVRAVLENRLQRGAGVKKFYTIGPMFRYERPQKGRYRQFHQINCEALGSDAPELDAEVILMLMDLLRRLGAGQVRLLLNSLGCPGCQVDFRARLSLFLHEQVGWCEDCARRRETNPLRVLDCKSQHCQALLQQGPLLRDCLCEGCATHYSRVLKLLGRFQVPYEEQPRLVRGLDYYTRTAFEVAALGLGSQDAVAGGGRYNGLARDLGGPDLPSIGFAIGEDRLMELLPPDPKGQPKGIFLAALGPAAQERALPLLQELRRQGLAAEMDFDNRSLKAQMTLADRLGAKFVVILGDRELAQGQALVRRMADLAVKTGEKELAGETEMPLLSVRRMSGGEQQAVPFAKLVAFLMEQMEGTEIA